MFKELGRPEQAEELIQFFVQNRHADREFWDLNENPFADHVTDDDVRNAINEKFSTFVVEQPNPADVLMKIGTNEGWNNSDIALLAALPIEQYVEIFKHSTGADLRRHIKGALSFDRIVNASNEMREISGRVKSALKRIGQESAINARRVQKYGIKVDE